MPGAAMPPSTQPDLESPETAPAAPPMEGSPQDVQQPHLQTTPLPAEAQSAKGKEKKKVGFASDSQDTKPSVARSPAVVVTPSGQEAEDYFSFTPNDAGNPFLTPTGPSDINKRDSFNRDELTHALAQILKPEHHGGPLSHPRPVLRKQTVLESPAEPYGMPLRSEVEAKNRADRLAVAVGSSSAPASRRTSFDDDDEERFERAGFIRGGNGVTDVATHDFAPLANSTGVRPRRGTGAEQVATELVRSHTRRKAPEERPLRDGYRSGTATPVAYDLEYVPRPTTYKGGILGSILKLYGDKPMNSGENSSPSTPSRTPRTTPPTSTPGTPRLERPRSGLWGLRAHNSSSTLTGLLESSAMFAAPGSKDISDAFAEKLKQEQERERARNPKKRKSNLFKQMTEEEQFHITVHIADVLSRHQYLVKLCRALMLYGAPTHRLEAYLAMSARVLRIEGQFLYLPGTMIISFDDSNTHTTEVKIVRAVQGVDLGRLRDVHEIYKEVVHDLLGVEEATERLDKVMQRRDKFPIWLRVLLYGLASATVAPFGFEGRYIDMPIAFFLGCVVGTLQLIAAPSNALYANVFEISAAVLTSFLSRMFGSLRGGNLFCFSSLAQSSIALILPGYMVLCSSLELQSHQMVAGSVRMVYALIYSLFLGYGITIGSVLYGYIDSNAVSNVHCSAHDAWYLRQPSSNFYLLFVLPFTISLCAINQAKWRQTPVMAFISLAGYCVNTYSSRYFKGNSSTLSNTLGALCIGVLANFYSRLGPYLENFWLDVWERYIEPRIEILKKGRRRPFVYDRTSDPEAQHVEKPILRHVRKIGYGLAAAAMLPAIFVQVPSGLAVSGSLLSGIASADMITRNMTLAANGTVINGTESTTSSSTSDLNSTAFTVLFSVIQVAISISVGLSLSALLVYPLGKRRSGLFSF